METVTFAASQIDLVVIKSGNGSAKTYTRSGRADREKRVVERMIRLYCRKKERNDELCPACRELIEYARMRLEHCRFGAGKPTCRQCPVHCYRPEMRARIREVMRWAGPRMVIYHPVSALLHLGRELGERLSGWLSGRVGRRDAKNRA